jgi:hypothetical protein
LDYSWIDRLLPQKLLDVLVLGFWFVGVEVDADGLTDTVNFGNGSGKIIVAEEDREVIEEASDSCVGAMVIITMDVLVLQMVGGTLLEAFVERFEEEREDKSSKEWCKEGAILGETFVLEKSQGLHQGYGSNSS